MIRHITWPTDHPFVRVQPNGCWLWQRSLTSHGYARLGRRGYVHRLVYEAARGPIPTGTEIDHLCRTLACVNPAHLEAVTHRENMARGLMPCARALRENRCVHGHDLSDAYRRGDGTRICRECTRLRNKAKRTIQPTPTKGAKA